jgi:hypothetical protein
MDATDISGILELTPSATGDAIRQIVQVFEDEDDSHRRTEQNRMSVYISL